MANNNDTHSLCVLKKTYKRNILVIKLYYVPGIATVIVMETLIINARHHSIREF